MKNSPPEQPENEQQTKARKFSNPSAADEPSLVQRLGIKPTLSAAIDPKDIVRGGPYFMFDSQGRVLGSDNGGVNGRAVMLPSNYYHMAIPIAFDQQPTASTPSSIWFYPITNTNDAQVTGLAIYGSVPSSLPDWNWLDWFVENDQVGSANFFKGFFSKDDSTFTDGTFSLCEDGDGYVGWGNTKDNTPIQFSVLSYNITGNDIYSLVLSTWPNLIILNAHANLVDDTYSLMDDDSINGIYKNSPLAGMQATNGVFACDDFSYAYKAYASLAFYKDQSSNVGIGRPAIGVLIGQTNGPGSAMNFFVDITGNIKIFDPTTGSILDPSDWKYSPVYMVL
ncbi:hypothetical protein PHO31112_03763 [Pandoraea horticolens]|uniref:Agglutinin C-terminal domain-containing protein n=1 Tax=Pandoraea horticolens TaxID=2508298 RepID=A0A5E4XBM9_9BURK|nr:lectin MOA-related protein [Pandoraea horticolens]VVE33615.1 hypothetical protein PHO31112_03763 [Pandoraea horticolens]